MNSTFAKTALIVSVLSAVAVVQAADASYSTTVALETTNYTKGFVLPKFDPTLGTLTAITFSLKGDVLGNVRAESLDAASTTLSLNLGAEISLLDPMNNTLAVVIPTVTESFNASAFDGAVDFGGTSGVSYLNRAATKSTTVSPALTPSILSTFVGVGNVTLNLAAKGASTGSGAGNLITQFQTQAGSAASVTYTYQPVPEPASVAALAIGALGLLRRRRA